ncbi:MAG TPA: TetR/AcrR family transcriptional regulator [Solirubrobacteraceae bacterium]|jgi:AcrR family transcriptional regulator/DNA-binding MarR family transcriptional regulator
MFEVATQRGASNVTVAHVVERSGVSRRTFYDLFTDREDCLRAAFEQALGYASERVLPAYEAAKDWRGRIRAALVALLGFLDEEPLFGRLLIVESLGGEPATQQRRAQILAAVTSTIEQGREQAKAGTSIPSLAGEGIVGGALTVIHSRLVGKDGKPLLELANPLMSMIVLPYLGSTAARRELKCVVPSSAARRQDSVLLSYPFKDMGMRLTYRTVKVLTAIAEHPGASNRFVGDTAEIRDQGQISKLLGRLERVGMVCNTALGSSLGAPNAWTLTASGRQVIATIGAHAEGRPARGDER